MSEQQSLAAILDRPAAEWRAALSGRHLRLSPAGRVHDVVLRTWIGGIRVPVARCGASTPGGPFAGYAATDEAVTCRGCGAAGTLTPASPMLPLC